ncbi:NACHT, LRR and PYD domains-containing protein 4 [Panthera pardus]|uniref:NACHT, LRR and PYD domains-containing protein 4 n=1 Tax=Panthera pardus TaxID=9691 RepID=A0A9V1F3R9_PANPR|nr:NACHT, LRR and PYD domains-containing protein 4 [Panthera pardus]
MASSFFSDFGLMWYLKELKKDEFRKFKELLKQEPLKLGLKIIPWTEVKKATREDLANLLMRHYKEQQAWNVTFSVFNKINRKDLCEKAKKEITGHTKLYQMHVKEKFNNMWLRESIPRIQDHLHSELTQRERECLELFFAPKETGKQTRTVLLKGVQGIGKTTFLIRLMLAWVEGNLYQERFSYVFYLCCREMKQLTETSLAALLSRGWSDSSTPFVEILSQPERLLFLIDSFEELKCSLSEPESDLCSDCMEQVPVQVLLSSLLRKKLLPESSLLITAAPVYPQEVEDRLECPEIRTLLGFSDSDKKIYFCSMFQDRNRAMEAFSFMRENGHLFIMCQIPILCWIVSTCLKQEMEKGKDLALTCRRTTSLYSSFIFNLFTPKGASCPDEQSQGQLKGLCSLAAEGMWTNMFLFSEGDLRRNGLVDSDISTLLDIKALQKCKEEENSYMFLHVSVQEFCAAMFYFLKSHMDHPNPAIGCRKAVLFTYLKKEKVHWISLGCFIFGLLNEKEQEKLDTVFGFHLSQEIQQECHQCLQRIGENKHLQKQIDFLALCYCLFEMQNEVFVQWAMDFFQDVHFTITDHMDLRVSAYCLKYCSNLQKLCFSIQNVFQVGNADSSVSSYNILCWHDICSVLTTNEHLRELQMSHSILSESTYATLCHQLRHPSCHLQKLQMNNVTFAGDRWLFFEVLTHSPDLKYLNLSGTTLSRNDVKLLCNALNNPMCNVEELLLANCHLSADDCEAFTCVLNSSKKLKLLNVSYNYLDQGVPLLCEALQRPDCGLEGLILGYCYLTEHSWKYLYNVLLYNKSLTHLDLSANVLKYENLKLLCEALKQPGCHLWSLCLVKCSITADGCRDLASVLTGNQNLRSLQISYNDIEDAGVKLLCQGLAHPSCHLEILGLATCKLTSACCEDLSSALTSSKTLQSLNLQGNALDHTGVAVLCEALRHPACTLQILGLQKTEFDEETQRLLTVAEEENPSLTVIGDW